MVSSLITSHLHQNPLGVKYVLSLIFAERCRMVVVFYGGDARCTGGGGTPIVWMKGRHLIR
jgi:hypothetical protein